MEYADDDLLSDIAALGEADGAIFDAGFKRNRVLVHVDVKERYATFDAAGFHRVCADLDCAGGPQRFTKTNLQVLGNDDFESPDSDLVAHQHQDGQPGKIQAPVGMERKRSKQVLEWPGTGGGVA